MGGESITILYFENHLKSTISLCNKMQKLRFKVCVANRHHKPQIGSLPRTMCLNCRASQKTGLCPQL